ncbi:unnamed protein product [Mycena citricolor]|uniref:MYND-type domain-containing protein n=1 Tax=Mycena citricolor TaxID=2018698 RepID=A0AAD2HZC0_9AGAR|nr:unnamed protein product [Mycena citricolor]CAK5282957.1 unnamed protein product [Mycena citricolor]
MSHLQLNSAGRFEPNWVEEFECLLGCQRFCRFSSATTMPEETLRWANIARLPARLQNIAKTALSCKPEELEAILAIPKLPPCDQAALLPLLFRLLEPPQTIDHGDDAIPPADYILKTYPVLQSIELLLRESLIPEMSIVSLWPRIWQCLCMHQMLDDRDVVSLEGTDVRKLALSVLRQLCVSDRWLSGASPQPPVPFGIVHVTPGLIRHLVHLWRRAVFDLSWALPYTSDLGRLLCSLLIFNHAAPHVQGEIFEACGGTCVDYAMFVIQHIRITRREKEWHEATMLPWTVQSLTALLEITVAYSDVLIDVLMDMGLAAGLVKLSLCLDRIGRIALPVTNGAGVMLTLQGPIFTLLTRAKPNPSWVRQALCSGLLPAIAKTNLGILASPGTTSMNADTLFPNQMKLLSDVLPGQLTSYSVLAYLERALVSLEETQLKFPIGPLVTPWSRMLPLLKARFSIKKDFDSRGRVGVILCDGPQCPQDSSKKQFKRCSQCRQVFYCNKHCQTRLEAGHTPVALRQAWIQPASCISYVSHTDRCKAPAEPRSACHIHNHGLRGRSGRSTHLPVFRAPAFGARA